MQSRITKGRIKRRAELARKTFNRRVNWGIGIITAGEHTIQNLQDHHSSMRNHWVDS
jgi:hypothetical protein